MATYTVNTSDAEDEALTKFVARHNEADGTTLTNQQVLRRAVQRFLDEEVAHENRTARRVALEQSFADADPTTRQQVRALLNMADYL